MRKNVIFVCAVLLFALAARASNGGTLLDAGYDAMYNLQFEEAHRAFQNWQRLHPEDPMGPASDAAAYLFAEFDRLHILEFELFTDDQRFVSRSAHLPDPRVRQEFETRAAQAKQLADTALARDPRDGNALFASALLFGLRGDYLALVEKRELQALKFLKQGRMVAESLLAADPSYYDAYLAVGVENYLLSLKSAPVRWFLRLGGAETDKAVGLQKLHITAEHGRYLRPYARLLLAVAALRDRDQERARSLLADLARQYPHNRLYVDELARLQHPKD